MIRPLRDRIVVKPLDESYSGVIHRVKLDTDITRGEILACGPKAQDCKPGDVIQFTHLFKFPEIKYHGQSLRILQEADIAGIEEQGSYRSKPMLFDRPELTSADMNRYYAQQEA